jgi:hypothetical protein
MNPPFYLYFYILSVMSAFIVLVTLGLSKLLDRPDWPPVDRDRAVRVFAIALTGWFLAAIVLSWMGVYDGFADRMPTIQYGIFVPVLVGIGFMWRSKLVARVIDAIPQPWLVGVQIVRVVGAIFLVLYAAGHIPGFFAWPAGIGDILVGILAPVIALAYARSPDQNADLVFWWNIFGLADFAVAIATGFASSPWPYQLVAFDLPNELITRFPLVLIPVFGVPLCILLHLASLMKLRKTWAARRLRVV